MDRALNDEDDLGRDSDHGRVPVLSDFSVPRTSTLGYRNETIEVKPDLKNYSATKVGPVTTCRTRVSVRTHDDPSKPTTAIENLDLPQRALLEKSGTVLV